MCILVVDKTTHAKALRRALSEPILLRVYFHANPAALLLRCLTPQTDRQYSYYAKKFKGCLSSEIICVEHDTHIGIRVRPVKYSL